MSNYSIHPAILRGLNDLPGIKPEEKARVVACLIAYSEPREVWDYLPYLMGRVTNCFYAIFNRSNWNIAQDALELHMRRVAFQRLEKKYPTPASKRFTLSNGRSISLTHVQVMKLLDTSIKHIANGYLDTWVLAQNKYPAFTKSQEMSIAEKMNYIPLLRDGIDEAMKVIKAKKT